MTWPVLAQQKEFSQGLLGALWDEFWISKGFEISAVVKKGRQVNVDLLNLYFA